MDQTFITLSDCEITVDPPSESGRVCITQYSDRFCAKLFLTKEDVENMLKLFKEGD